VLITLTIGSLLMVSVMSATHGLSNAQARVQGRADHLAEARRAMQTILGELRNVRRDALRETSTVVGRRGIGAGNSDRIELQVIDNRQVRPDAAESDQYEVSFFLENRGDSPLPSLMCRKDHAFDDYPQDGGIVSVVAEGIVGLTIDYYFAGEWKREWVSTEPQPPQAVRVTIAAATTPNQTNRRDWNVVELSSVVTLHAARRIDIAQDQNAPRAGGQPR
jgi:type II secretory pathway component PulJ